ncbi:Pre-mRNA-splicing factor cwc15 [Pestalotiopsis fici W106-1]|uniref:Pre-mRNA-splicing factor cwc15 n=1 Tax=Pestalotiopsis fici (strain W106-1 / CGMCC3.15140) TaxID=1229662 RepID=W3X5K2_PESFW|nr:Pre-mRNA-splicing factor cwc15 [Pestalotiopsis fici W106-1]ETS80466.1 Pre-mRNA-splicing factor cwc15 [Pestalotiopsis fici W106-1]
MTTAHRPTFDPAQGKEALRGPAYHQRLLPAYTQLKFRQPGQGGDADADEQRDLRAELLAAEAAHFAKKNGTPLPPVGDDAEAVSGGATAKRPMAITADGEDEDPEAKRRRILEETRDIDADSEEDDDDDDDSDDSSDDDSDDEEAELQRELEKIKAERAAKKQKEEEERAAREEDERERDIALGNPLLNKQNFTMKRRWDDDVVFKNQARGTDEKGKKKEFVNDLLRSDFHKRFMDNPLDFTPTSHNTSLFVDEILLIRCNNGQIILVLECSSHLLKGFDFEQGTAIEISERRSGTSFWANGSRTGIQGRLAMNLVLMSKRSDTR